ncbi:MAG: SusC/RagA family TonB-linked outer membrane protein, partial [Bacteroidales bacterium]
MLLLTIGLFAQESTTIRGTVVMESDREPVVGATIVVKGTTIGTTTDMDGNYSLSVPSSATEIIISYIGMQTISIPYSKANHNKLRYIEMKEDSEMLDDVVVVGFGVQKKESVIGAIQTVKSSDLTVPSSSLTTAFAGKIAGVIAVQRSGEPGADGADFWIRGVSTFAGPTNPLIVLDGVEITSAELNSLAPESIESFSILKDATATALYGAKGANGVMVVTTKSGKDLDKPRINVRAEYFTTQPISLPKYANGVDFMTLYNEAQQNRSPGIEPFYSENKINGTRDRLNQYIYPNVDWYNLLFKNSSDNFSANLNVTGGSKKVDYFVNAAIFNESGMYRNNNINAIDNNISVQKFNFQNNINAQLTSSTKVSLRMLTQLRNYGGPGQDSRFLFEKAVQANPVEFPAYFPSEENSNHIFFGGQSNNNIGNPLAYLLSSQRTEFEANILSSFSIEQKLDFITPGLSARGLASFQYYSKNSTKIGYDPYSYEIREYDPFTYDYTLTQLTTGTDALAVKEVWNGNNLTTNFQLAFDYNRTFANRHTVSGMLLYHQREYKKPSDNIYKNLPFREQGIAGRFTYNYDNRYFTEFNFGYNGSDNFKKGHRFGFFPSIAAGYMLSNEEYFEPIQDQLSLLKIRGSIGLVGNSFTDPRFPYLTEVQLNSSDKGFTFGDQWNNYLPGLSINKYGQDGARWETGLKTNGGIEIGLYNKLTLIADAFQEVRSGIFMQRRVMPSTVGIGSALP